MLVRKILVVLYVLTNPVPNSNQYASLFQATVKTTKKNDSVAGLNRMHTRLSSGTGKHPFLNPVHVQI